MEKSIYNEAFYDLQSKESYESALVVLALLRQKLGEKIKLDSIMDFGCGVGGWLAAAKEVGFKHVCGTDGEYVPKGRLMIKQDEFLPNDLSVPSKVNIPGEKFDFAMSLEVAEHLPEEVASDFVVKLVSTSDIVLFSAAIPYQGGHGHVNENWLEYWAKFFREQEFIPVDLLRADIWYDSRVCWWYKQNCMLFVQNNVLELLPANTLVNPILSVIHPEQFLVAEHRESVHKNYSLGADMWYFRESFSKEHKITRSYGSEHAVK